MFFTVILFVETHMFQWLSLPEFPALPSYTNENNNASSNSYSIQRSNQMRPTLIRLQLPRYAETIGCGRGHTFPVHPTKLKKSAITAPTRSLRAAKKKKKQNFNILIY